MLATSTVENRQKVLRLLVNDALIGPEKTTVRHLMPPAQHDLGPAPDDTGNGDFRDRGKAPARLVEHALRQV